MTFVGILFQWCEQKYAEIFSNVHPHILWCNSPVYLNSSKSRFFCQYRFSLRKDLKLKSHVMFFAHINHVMCPMVWTPGKHDNNTIAFYYYSDAIIPAIASQITSITIVYSTVYSGADQRKHQSSASLAFGWGIQRWPIPRKDGQ